MHCACAGSTSAVPLQLGEPAAACSLQPAACSLQPAARSHSNTPWAQVLLLLSVLVRHLQRFSLGTCHAWAHVPAESILVCASNNLLQVGATEGLSNLSPNPNLNPSLLQWAPLFPVGQLHQANC